MCVVIVTSARSGIVNASLPAASAPPLGLPAPPIPTDNPQSPEKIALGDKLFHDKRFSSTKQVACAECHKPDARGVVPYSGVPHTCASCHADAHGALARGEPLVAGRRGDDHPEHHGDGVQDPAEDLFDFRVGAARYLISVQRDEDIINWVKENRFDGYSPADDPAIRDIPVIMISALDDMASIVRCIEAGAHRLRQLAVNHQRLVQP